MTTAIRAKPKFRVSAAVFPVSALLAVSLLKAVGLGSISDASLVMAVATFGYSVLCRHGVMPAAQKVALAFLAFGLLHALLTALQPSIIGIKSTVGVFIGATIYLYFNTIARSIYGRNDVIFVAILGATAIFLAGIGSGAIVKNTTSGLVIYPVLLAGALVVARAKRPTIAGVIFFFAVAVVGFALEHRTVSGMGAASGTAFVLLRIAPFRIFSALAIIGLAAGVGIIIAYYTGIGGFDIRHLNAAITDISGRNAVSGRQLIWPIILSETAQSPWFGLGTGMTFEQMYPNTTWSAHSYFLQTYMQTGLIGVGGLVLLLVTVWRSLPPLRQEDPLSCYALALFALLIVHSALEVFLMQTSLAIGAGAWMTLGTVTGLASVKGRKLSKRRRLRFKLATVSS